MTTTEVISIINIVGLAAIVPIGLGLLIEKKKKKFEARQEHKAIRYKAVIMLAYYLINFDRDRAKLAIPRPDLQSIPALVQELEAEWVNMALYASDKTILAMKQFVKNSNEITFRELAMEMRRELYGIKTNLKVEDITLEA